MSAGFKSATDTSSIDALDFDPPCGVTALVHDLHGTGDAEYMVWTRGCDGGHKHSGSGLMCDGCLQHYLTSPLGTKPCTKCGHKFFPARELILRFERIKP